MFELCVSYAEHGDHGIVLKWWPASLWLLYKSGVGVLVAERRRML